MICKPLLIFHFIPFYTSLLPPLPALSEVLFGLVPRQILTHSAALWSHMSRMKAMFCPLALTLLALLHFSFFSAGKRARRADVISWRSLRLFWPRARRESFHANERGTLAHLLVVCAAFTEAVAVGLGLWVESSASSLKSIFTCPKRSVSFVPFWQTSPTPTPLRMLAASLLGNSR